MSTNMRQEFITAAQKNDAPYLRSFIASEIINDPTFKRGVCDDCMTYLKTNGVDITVPYELNTTEEPTPTDKTKWDKRLFLRKVEYLRKNFAYDERIGELREIGKVAYHDESASEKANFVEAPKGQRSEKKNTSLAALIGAIAAVAAIIAVIVLLLKK